MLFQPALSIAQSPNLSHAQQTLIGCSQYQIKNLGGGREKPVGKIRVQRKAAGRQRDLVSQWCFPQRKSRIVQPPLNVVGQLNSAFGVQSQGFPRADWRKPELVRRVAQLA